ncbi:MAG: 2-oxo acid dehydrogenase subunit E2 [Clostridiales bacterium]|nr:2-oxo acid dehydrogenase subunit E2 [Clostridiales bacterium]
MAKVVIMPRQGISVESCIITKWMKAVGDAVKPGDILFSYETDKAAFDEEAQDEGVLLYRFHDEGDDVPCLEPVCIIGEADEDISDLRGSASAGESADEPAPAAQEPPDEAPAPTRSAPVRGEALKASPRARRQAERLGVAVEDAIPSGPDGRVIERDVLALHGQGAASTKAASGAPAAQLAGTGIGGRVTAADRTAPAPQAQSAAAAPASVAAYEDKPLAQIRKVIARTMHSSLSQMAQLTHHTSFDATSILAYRERLKASAEAMGLPNITLGDIVSFAVSRVLPHHPDLNAHLLDGVIRRFSGVHLGMAVDTDRGLMVPTLFDADSMSLAAIAARSKELAAACRSGSVSPDALTGGTFTVTNLGTLGVEMFTPVINPPQTGILGVCSIVYRPRKGRDGAIEFYPAMGLSLTYDHRALDGSPASRFLRELCDALEHFDVLLSR